MTVAKDAKKADVSVEKPVIGKEDLEAKFRQLAGGVEETTVQVKNTAIAAGSAIVVLLVLLSFLMGKKRGVKGSTVVEIRRI